MSEEEPREHMITDKEVTDKVLNAHPYTCDRDDPNSTLFYFDKKVWKGGPVAENEVRRLLGEIFKDKECRSQMKTDKVIEFVKSSSMDLPKPAIKPPYILAFQNGFLFLKDCTIEKLIPYKMNAMETIGLGAEFFYANLIPHDYEAKATCPKWDKFINEVLRPEDVNYAQELFGYCLYDSMPEPLLHLNIGGGNNGKTVFNSVLLAMVGEQNNTAQTLQSLAYGPYAIAQLHYKLTNISDEVGNSSIKNTANIKAAIGGGIINAREIYGRQFDFKPYAKLIYNANEPPELIDESGAIFNKLKFLDFPYEFFKEPKTGQRKARDRNELIADLLTEMQGIINWSIIGLRRLMGNNFKFSFNRTTEEVKNWYETRSNPVSMFKESCLEETEDYHCILYPQELYSIFKSWLKEFKVKKQLTYKAFCIKMNDLGLYLTQPSIAKGKRVYEGLKLLPSHAKTPNLQPLANLGIESLDNHIGDSLGKEGIESRFGVAWSDKDNMAQLSSNELNDDCEKCSNCGNWQGNPNITEMAFCAEQRKSISKNCTCDFWQPILKGVVKQ